MSTSNDVRSRDRWTGRPYARLAESSLDRRPDHSVALSLGPSNFRSLDRSSNRSGSRSVARCSFDQLVVKSYNIWFPHPSCILSVCIVTPPLVQYLKGIGLLNADGVYQGEPEVAHAQSTAPSCKRGKTLSKKESTAKWVTTGTLPLTLMKRTAFRLTHATVCPWRNYSWVCASCACMLLVHIQST